MGVAEAPSKETLDDFEQAFSSRISGCVRDCDCGRRFWDSYNTGYDWEEGEEDRLWANPKATALPHSVGSIQFEGHEYVMDCTCWHARAARLIAFIRGHDEAIAEFLSAEKRRKQREADRAPVVK